MTFDLRLWTFDLTSNVDCNMPISYAETVPITCPRCGTAFDADPFIIVDGVERPDLVQRMLDDSLHDTVCPSCGQAGRVAAPLLYHDGSKGRVLLGVPPGMPEDEWREIGQTLLWTLIGALPERARLPYLGDVQAEAGIQGIAEIIRREQLAGFASEGPAAPPDRPEQAEAPPIVYAIEALLTAQGPQALEAALRDHPILDEPQAVTILQELAAEATRQAQPEAAHGFARAATLLEQLKATRSQEPAVSVLVDLPHAPPEQVEALAFALLRSTSAAELAQAVDEYPELLEAWAGEALLAYIAAAQAGGKGRIADGLAERLDALGELRRRYQDQKPVLEAVQAYLEAGSEDELEQVVLERDELTGDAADEALQRLASGARDDGDADFAAFVEQRLEFLRRVRAALEEND